MDNLRVQSAIDLVRDQPSLFFEGGKPSMEQLVSLVMRDVSCRADFKSDVCRIGNWAMVSADCDWLSTPRASVEQLFDRFVISEDGGVNRHRAEVLLMAVCDGVMTVGANGTFFHRLSLSDLPPTMSDRAKLAARVLAWRFTPT